MQATLERAKGSVSAEAWRSVTACGPPPPPVSDLPEAEARGMVEETEAKGDSLRVEGAEEGEE